MNDKKTTIEKLTPEELAEAAEKYNAEQAAKREEIRREKRRERQRIYDAKRKASGKSLTIRYSDASTAEIIKKMLVGLDAYAKGKGATTKAEAERLIALFQKPATATPAASQQPARPTAAEQAQSQPQAPQTTAKPQVSDQPAK